jgi:hypothetical protein
MRVGLRLPDDAGGRVLITDADGQEIGHIEAAVDGRRLDVRWVEVEVGRRRWGLGMDAVRLLEEEVSRRWKVGEVRAVVPVEVGLGLYFWLRLGYRPEEPVRCEGDAMAMVRELK